MIYHKVIWLIYIHIYITYHKVLLYSIYYYIMLYLLCIYIYPPYIMHVSSIVKSFGSYIIHHKVTLYIYMYLYLYIYILTRYYIFM